MVQVKRLQDCVCSERQILIKRYSENMLEIYRRTPMPKCEFNKVAEKLYWYHTSAWVSSCKFAAYFQNTFLKKHLLHNIKKNSGEGEQRQENKGANKSHDESNQEDIEQELPPDKTPLNRKIISKLHEKRCFFHLQ